MRTLDLENGHLGSNGLLRQQIAASETELNRLRSLVEPSQQVVSKLKEELALIREPASGLLDELIKLAREVRSDIPTGLPLLEQLTGKGEAYVAGENTGEELLGLLIYADQRFLDELPDQTLAGKVRALQNTFPIAEQAVLDSLNITAVKRQTPDLLDEIVRDYAEYAYRGARRLLYESKLNHNIGHALSNPKSQVDTVQLLKDSHRQMYEAVLRDNYDPNPRLASTIKRRTGVTL